MASSCKKTSRTLIVGLSAAGVVAAIVAYTFGKKQGIREGSLANQPGALTGLGWANETAASANRGRVSLIPGYGAGTPGWARGQSLANDSGFHMHESMFSIPEYHRVGF